MSVVLPRRATLGAGALLGVMLLVVAAAGVLAVYYADRADAERRAEDREAGRVFALWFAAAHRESMENQNAYRVPDGAGGFAVTVSVLSPAADLAGAAPPGLPETVGRLSAGVSPGFSVGIIDDGAGVPMAFGVLEPEAWAHTASLSEGALEGGLAQIEEFGDTGSEMHGHVTAIAAALGRTPATDALFVTADRGVRYADRVLYRRAQPGQSRLNRMEAALKANRCGLGKDELCDVLNGGAVEAAYVDGNCRRSDGTKVACSHAYAVVPPESSVGGDGSVAGRTEAAELNAGYCEDAGANRVACGPGVARVVRGTLTAVEISGNRDLNVVRDLVVGIGESQAMSAGSLTVVEREADRVVDPGESDAFVLQGLYTPRATISGQLTVGSCAGCFPE